MRLDLEAFGEQQFSREILRVGRNAGDMRPAFNNVHDLLLDVEQAQFSTEGAAYSGGWRPLAASTVAYKARNNLDPRILHATLRLRNSLTQRSHPDHVYDVSSDDMFVGSRVEYGQFHQRGNPNMPRRRPFQLDNAVRSEIVKILQRHLLG